MAENTLRSTLEAAYDKQSAPAPAPEPAAPPPDVAPKAAIGTDAKPEPIGKPRDPSTGQYLKADKKPEAPKQKGDDAAPASGQVKAGGETVAPPPAVAAPPAETAPKPPRKLPADMSATARELASKLPPEFSPLLDEWEKRHKETSRALSESAQARQFAQEVQRSLSPYETIARANGMDAMSWAGQALQTVASLYAGTPQQKAQVIAQAIALSGVDVEAINQAMQNPQAARAAAPQQPDIRSGFRRMWEEQIGQEKSRVAEQQARDFIASEPEFLQEVAPQMVAILRAAEAAGRPMSYQDAHAQAIWANPEVRAILLQREAAKAATATNAATQRASEAASSIRSTPSTAPAAKPQGLRASLEAAYDELSRK